MTLRTSEVAVWRSRVSRSSLSRRVFSMAMTAWAAKFSQKFYLLLGKRSNLLTVDDDHANQLILLKHWYGDHSAGASEVEEVSA
jgi:hypothetical protein